ncbi:RsbRD N-terminal domain-containing protein [Desulfatiglans anilini]|uniref:RsbRD N-terminal domain-containing protein n=1 Tax=Desulfatiglans anilini TaxID=90728 RepID=UPI000402107D|nr:RsbRD N-terminal domain-containing protein [Desulfatiglans anilini]
MHLTAFLIERRSAIVKRWRDVLFESYEPEGRDFLRRQKDPFSNPVGATLSGELEAVYDHLVSGGSAEDIAACLDRIIRIRAVQDFSPSKALAFLIQLKPVIRKELQGAKSSGAAASAELLELEDRIDALALQGFDVYTACRQHLNELRVREIRNEVGKLLERANARYAASDRQVSDTTA